MIGGLSGFGRVSAFSQGNSSNNNTLELSPSVGTHTFNGAFANGDAGRILHLTKSGAGPQIFGSDSMATYTGTTSVTEGILRINGNFASASGAVTVSGGTLGGSGIIGGATTIQSGGTLAPGNSPGLLTFNNSLTLEGSAVFEINGASRGVTYDAVNVGTALTYGGTFTATFGTTLGEGTHSFDLFDFGSQSGTFTTISSSALYTFTLDSGNGYSFTDVDTGNVFAFAHATGILSVTIAALEIPEPASFAALAGLGILGLAASRRRRA
jgi:autotransporter-associated beta strand protein